MEELLSGFVFEEALKPNFIKIPINYLFLEEEDIERFNSIYRFLLENVEKKITRTPSGGISTAGTALRGNQWDHYYKKNHCVALTFKYNSNWYRIQIGGRKKETFTKEDKQSGTASWKIFIRLCEKYGIDINQYRISESEGLKEKTLIPSPIIRLGRDSFEGKTFENVHHIDRNSSYSYGILEKYPELSKPLEELYSKRKEHPEYKQVLAHIHGVMQSYVVNYEFAHIARAANESNRSWLIAMARKVRNAGGQILLYNTDGFWYQGDIYHDNEEGVAMGEWKNDHVNCKFRAKSCGAYEYIENGKYYPVYRGTSTFEKNKPRSKWNWGDIFKGEIRYWKFEEKIGIIRDMEAEKWL